MPAPIITAFLTWRRVREHIGAALLVGALEFVGSNERGGWRLAGSIVPIAYVAWSIWLIALGALLIL